MTARIGARTLITAAVAALAAIVGFVWTGFAQHIEHWSANLQIAYLSERRPAQYPHIALVAITDETLKDFPYTQPVDRALLAALVRRLDEAGPAVIGLDFVFDRPTEPDKDRLLAETVRNASSKIVMGALDVRTPSQQRGLTYQSEFLEKTGRPAGHLYFEENYNPLLPNNRVVRYFAEPIEDGLHRDSFSEVLAREYGRDAPFRTRYISWLLPPSNDAETFLTLPAELVLGGDDGLPLRDLVRGRVVIVGGGFTDRDRHLTPLSLRGGERHSGAEIHAQMLAQLLDRRSIRVMPWPLELAIYLSAAALGFWLGRRDRIGHAQLWVRSLGAVAVTAASALIFASAGIVFPITVTLLLLLAGTTFGYHSRRLA